MTLDSEHGAPPGAGRLLVTLDSEHGAPPGAGEPGRGVWGPGAPRPLSCPLTSLCVQLCCPPGHVYSGYGAGSNYEEYDDDESDYQLLARPLCEKYRQGDIFQKKRKKQKV